MMRLLLLLLILLLSPQTPANPLIQREEVKRVIEAVRGLSSRLRLLTSSKFVSKAIVFTSDFV